MDELVFMLLRFLHFLFGIMWIGLLYYFNFVQTPFFGETDPAVRSGAIQKLVPRALWWFRWGAMGTVLFGLLYLLMWWGMRLNFAMTSWTVAIFTGGLMGLIMWANVWFVIWPNQKIVIGNATAMAGGAPANPAAAPAGRRAALASIRHNQCFQTGRRSLQPCEQIAALGGGNHRSTIGVGEPIADFRFGGVITDRHADRAGTGDSKTALHPWHRIRQHDRDGVARRDAVVGEMAGELAGALREAGVSHGRLRIAIGDFVAARGGVPAQQFRDRRDQVGVQHRFPQTML